MKLVIMMLVNDATPEQIIGLVGQVASTPDLITEYPLIVCFTVSVSSELTDTDFVLKLA